MNNTVYFVCSSHWCISWKFYLLHMMVESLDVNGEAMLASPRRTTCDFSSSSISFISAIRRFYNTKHNNAHQTSPSSAPSDTSTTQNTTTLSKHHLHHRHQTLLQHKTQQRSSNISFIIAIKRFYNTKHNNAHQTYPSSAPSDASTTQNTTTLIKHLLHQRHQTLLQHKTQQRSLNISFISAIRRFYNTKHNNAHQTSPSSAPSDASTTQNTTTLIKHLLHQRHQTLLQHKTQQRSSNISFISAIRRFYNTKHNNAHQTSPSSAPSDASTTQNTTTLSKHLLHQRHQTLLQHKTQQRSSNNRT